MTKLRFLFFGILFVASTTLNAQGAIKKKRTLNDKFFFGAGLGMQFGTITAVEVSPTVGYIPINNLYLGVTGTYEYYKSNSDIYGDFNTAIYGGSFFASYAFYQDFLLYAEYSMLNLESAYFDPMYRLGDKERFWLNTPLIGGGYLQSLGGRSKVMFLLLWNLDTKYGLYYNNPEFRISFLF